METIMSTLEQFDIIEYKKNKKDGEEYFVMLTDGTKVSRQEFSDGYFERSTPPTGWFYTYKEFYKNGSLFHGGQMFKFGDYATGVWVDYDENGTIIKQVDYDKDFKLTLEQVFAIAQKEGVTFSLDNPRNQLRRAVIDGTAVWAVSTSGREIGSVDEFGTGVSETGFQIEDSTGRVIRHK